MFSLHLTVECFVFIVYFTTLNNVNICRLNLIFICAFRICYDQGLYSNQGWAINETSVTSHSGQNWQQALFLTISSAAFHDETKFIYKFVFIENLLWRLFFWIQNLRIYRNDIVLCRVTYHICIKINTYSKCTVSTSIFMYLLLV